MVKRFIASLIFIWTTAAVAQVSQALSPIGVFIGDSIYRINPQTTQTETKAGWKIVDYQTKSKTVRYLWGVHSKQPIEDQQPSFFIDPGTSQLIDFAIIRLTPKRDYRKLPKAQLKECVYHTFDLYTVTTELLPDENYKVTLKEPLTPGEYIITQMTQSPVDNMGNIIVYPFTIVNTEARPHWNRAY